MPAGTDNLAEYAEFVATWFLRHGESAANAAGIFAGQGIDAPLTDVGRVQARHAAVFVPSSVEWIVSSPLSRATETAEIVPRVRGIPSEVEIDSRATEFDVGTASGLATRPIAAVDMVKEFGAEQPDECAYPLSSQ